MTHCTIDQMQPVYFDRFKLDWASAAKLAASISSTFISAVAAAFAAARLAAG